MIDKPHIDYDSSEDFIKTIYSERDNKIIIYNKTSGDIELLKIDILEYDSDIDAFEPNQSINIENIQIDEKIINLNTKKILLKAAQKGLINNPYDNFENTIGHRFHAEIEFYDEDGCKHKTEKVIYHAW